jgi:histidyl-tRNA synthetase
VLAVAVAYLREVGLPDTAFRVRIGHRAWLADRLSSLGVSTDRQLSTLRAIDRREKLPTDEYQRELADAGLDVYQAADLTALLDARDYGAYPPLRDLFGLLETYGLADCCEFDGGIVRGLTYYNSTVYEIWDARRELRAIAGGGRYDDLSVALGGDPMPGVGLGMGDVVLTLLLARERKIPALRRELDVFVACYSAAERPTAIRLAQELRSVGLSVDRSLQTQSLGRQLSQANSLGAGVAVIVAPEELARGEVVIRDMTTGEQRVTSLESLTKALAGSAEPRTGTRLEPAPISAHAPAG